MEVAAEKVAVAIGDVDGFFGLVLGELEQEIPLSALTAMPNTINGASCGGWRLAVRCRRVQDS